MSVHWSGASCEPWGRNERSNQKCIYAWSLVEETYRRLSLLYDIRPRHWGVGRNKQRRTLHDIVQKGLAMFNLCSLFFFARLLFCSSFFDLSCGFSSLPGWSCAIGSSHLIPSLPHSHPITTLSLPFLLLIGPMRSWNPGKISKLACERPSLSSTYRAYAFLKPRENKQTGLRVLTSLKTISLFSFS